MTGISSSSRKTTREGPGGRAVVGAVGGAVEAELELRATVVGEACPLPLVHPVSDATSSPITTTHRCSAPLLRRSGESARVPIYSSATGSKVGSPASPRTT